MLLPVPLVSLVLLGQLILLPTSYSVISTYSISTTAVHASYVSCCLKLYYYRVNTNSNHHHHCRYLKYGERMAVDPVDKDVCAAGISSSGSSGGSSAGKWY